MDNYGYHYAVMPKEERQRKLHNQYYFHCSCHACAKNWPLYSQINCTAQPLNPSESRQALADFNKSSKVFKRTFDAVLAGSYQESLPQLLEHLKLMDSTIVRPLREYNDCQEAIKQCYSAMANCYKPKVPGKKDKDM